MAGRFERKAELAIRAMMARGDRKIKVDSLAREMLMSSRTLQRRLTSEDVMFSMIKQRASNSSGSQLDLFER